MRPVRQRRELFALFLVLVSAPWAVAEDLQRLAYGRPGLVVDLGVGLWAWPLPMDYDGDGDLDLVVSCPDKPYGGVYFFENPGGTSAFPTFRRAVRIGDMRRNPQVSYVAGEPRVLTPGEEHPRFRENGFSLPRKIPVSFEVRPPGARVRANQWKLCDYEGDGDLDLVVGVGDWSDYGWDDAFDSTGRWTRGPLHGWVYLLLNEGTDEAPRYLRAQRIEAGGRPIDVYGMPSPNLADFDGDGDLDILCGEFLDRFTYFENRGTRERPEYAAGKFLTLGGREIRMDLEMIVPVAVDWDRDGDVDLVVGQEDGRVALLESSGKVEHGVPVFSAPRFFRAEAQYVKFGALVTPAAADWDGDGDEDLVCGNTAGYIGWLENLGGDPPRWAPPRYLTAGGEVIRLQAGPNGSIQGPCEAKWGYTTLSVADWDHDGLLDVVANSIWGKVVWYRNVGGPKRPELAAARSVAVEWPGVPPKPEWNWWDPRGKELVTQWRTRPLVIDVTGDGLRDLVMLDHEGYLALFERFRRGGGLALRPGRRVFLDADGKPLKLSRGRAGRSGRRKIALADWDGDGRLDLLVNSRNVDLWRNIAGREGTFTFENRGPLAERVLAGHTSSPAVVDWNRDGVPDLVVGAEDGFLYYLKNPRRAD
ncbi:MAG: VCBS repeat-containing protein [Planctomycetota bacterium]|nr:VCBS repeat-containing protein [Planctomycetota bacterium]